MKKIIVIVIVLFTAIVTMAYLYFSVLNKEQESSDSSLYASTLNSAFVFSFQNDKSILDILKGQNLLQDLVGDNNYDQVRAIRDHILSIPDLNRAIGKQNIYISLIPGKDKHIDLLYSTQLSSQSDKLQLMKSLKSGKLLLDTTQEPIQITLPDSSIFYLGIKDRLLLLSTSPQSVLNVLSATFHRGNEFVEYIKSTSKLSKNSLAELYINFETLPKLLKETMPGSLSGELSVLNDQQAFASLVYNFSQEKILFTGVTTISNKNDYYQLFADINAQKTTISNILPENTANYTVFAIENYTNWNSKLNSWFTGKKENKKIAQIKNNIDRKYHLNPDQVFLKYFKDQMVTFQLSTREKIGAINLSNGEKAEQLLLDFSTPYNDHIKLFKDPDLLYCYFGEPFKKFRRPYYIIIDNYMVFANNASTVQSFLNSYKNNKLLINNSNYTYGVNQLPNTSTISFFIDFSNSSNIFLKNIYLPYYRHIYDEKGLKSYQSFIYQLNGDNGKFQTNILMNRKPLPMVRDSLTIETDSL